MADIKKNKGPSENIDSAQSSEKFSFMLLQLKLFYTIFPNEDKLEGFLFTEIEAESKLCVTGN